MGIVKDVDIKVILLGGELVIRWDSESNNVFMTGPATTVFTGEIDIIFYKKWEKLKINENFLKLQSSYLFQQLQKR